MIKGLCFILAIYVLLLIVGYWLPAKIQSKYFWAIFFLIVFGFLLSGGFGFIELEDSDGFLSGDGSVYLMGTMVFAGCFAYLALTKKPSLSSTSSEQKANEIVEPMEKAPVNIEHQEETQDAPLSSETVVLPERLDTPLARAVFEKAIEQNLMEAVDGHYQWKKSKVLMAYMLGRIYCGDYPEENPYDSKKPLWVFGENGVLPDVPLQKLFNTKDLSQQRTNRKDRAVPDFYGEVDALSDWKA